MASELVLNGNRDEFRGELNRFVGILTGRETDSLSLSQSVFNTIGFAALSDIQADFIKKARGGTGEDGNTWPPLSKKYLAYGRRFGKGEQSKLLKSAGLDPRKNRHGVGGRSGILTKDQQKRWNQVYRESLANLAARFDIKDAKTSAAINAWQTIKEEGAKTKLEIFGDRKVEILRDTGVLFNSLSPGYLSGGGENYHKPSGEGGEQQIFNPLPNGVRIGSSVPYAATHNYGDSKRGIPARAFLPKEVPAAWQERWTAVGIVAIRHALRRFLESGRRAA